MTTADMGASVDQPFDAVTAWRAVGEARDAAGAVAALSPDVTLDGRHR